MNTKLIQGIFNLIVYGVEVGWESIQFNYKVDSSQSGYSGSYHVNGDDKYFKPSKLTSEQLTISNPKLFVNELSKRVINNPPSATS